MLSTLNNRNSLQLDIISGQSYVGIEHQGLLSYAQDLHEGLYDYMQNYINRVLYLIKLKINVFIQKIK